MHIPGLDNIFHRLFEFLFIHFLTNFLLTKLELLESNIPMVAELAWKSSSLNMKSRIVLM